MTDAELIERLQREVSDLRSTLVDVCDSHAHLRITMDGIRIIRQLANDTSQPFSTNGVLKALEADDKGAALGALRKSGFAVGQYFQHYKGGKYVITDLGVFENTLEPIVGYRASPMLEDWTWFRTLDDFRGSVPQGDTLVPRFMAIKFTALPPHK